MRGRTGISVGACGDPDLVTTAVGGDPGDPCPNSAYGLGVWCNEYDTKAWLESAGTLKASISAAWNVLVATEDVHGTSSEQLRLEEVLDQLFARYKKFPDESSQIWYGDNTELVYELINWMTTAACRLEELNRAIRKYKVKPPESPTPGGTSGTVPSYVPSGGRVPSGDKPTTQRIGETTLVLLGVSLLAGGAYLYARKKTGGGGFFPKTPLPPRSHRAAREGRTGTR